MTPLELLRDAAVRWLQQAARDVNAAKCLVDVEPSRSVFHSQQAAEKAMKGFLTFHQVPFRKTHDLTDLGSQCAAVAPELETLLRQVSDLTDYASAFRYPDAPYEPDAAEATAALLVAKTFCDQILSKLQPLEGSAA